MKSQFTQQTQYTQKSQTKQTTNNQKKNQQEKKPRFTKQALSQFSQSQYEDIIGKIRKDGVFTTGEKEIKKKENEDSQFSQLDQIMPLNQDDHEKRVQKLLSQFKVKEERDQQTIDQQNKIRSIMNTAFHGDNYEISFSMTEVDDLQEIENNQWECAISIKVTLLNKNTNVIHENIGCGFCVHVNKDTGLKEAEKMAKINGLYRTLQLFGISTAEFQEHFRPFIVD